MMSSTRKANYKSYFRHTLSTPTNIPRRTRYRMTKPTRLSQKYPPINNIVEPSVTPLEEQPVELVGLNADEGMDTETNCDSECSENMHENITPHPPLLFASARITKEESMLMLYGFLIRHKLSKSATADLLTLINFHLPQGVNIPPSMFLLEKDLAPDYSLVSKSFYCPDCETLVENGDQKCSACDKDIIQTELVKSGKFFITFNLHASFSKLLENPEVQVSLLDGFNRRSQPSTDDN